MAERPIIIKKIKKVSGHGHHGGAWKVAYADFVTAMMAFFLLLWLLSSTSKEQKEGIAEYFNPTLAIVNSTGAGQGFMGGDTQSSQTLNNDATISSVAIIPSSNSQKSSAETEEESFEDAKERLRQAIQDVPELKQLAESLIVDTTPEGLRIQIVDQDKKSMFPSGSAEMFGYTKKLIDMVSKVVSDMPNKIALGGHTDAVPFSSEHYSNWELSADRANASRQALIDAGIQESRISRVSGYADRELLDKENPTSSRNRRITILLLKEAKTPDEE